MKNKLFFMAAALLHAVQPAAQTAGSFDIFTYTAPKGFTLKENSSKIFYSKNEGVSYCQLFLFPAVKSQSTIEKDFETNWNFFARNAAQGVGAPVNKEKQEADGWKLIQGGAGGNYGGKPFVITVTTLTKDDVSFYMAAVFSDEKYLPAVEAFMGSISPDLKKYTQKAMQPASQPNRETAVNNSQPVSGSFQFTRTNFDDGWVSEPRASWVEAKKGNLTVLVHYPDKQADEYYPDARKSLSVGWDLLVAPRYSNAVNMSIKEGSVWDLRPDYLESELTENATGKHVYVVLYRVQNYNGKAPLVEITAPNKAAFEKEFGNYETNKTNKSWDKLDRLRNLNKFAIGPNDLKGTYTSDFGAAVNYVYVATGLSAGMDTYSSAESFSFSENGQYEWNISIASGMVGNIQFKTGKSAGVATLPDNWHINFSNVSGNPHSHEAHFTCIRNGLRILWLDGKPYAKKN